MTKQGKIKEGIETVLRTYANFGYDRKAAEVVNYLHSQGAVLKVDSAEPPILFSEKFTIDSKLLAMIVERVRDTYRKAGYIYTEPLIEGEK